MLKRLILLAIIALIVGGALAYWQSGPSDDSAEIPSWMHFPGEYWETITPEKAGLHAKQFMAWAESQSPQLGVGYGGQEPDSGGIVITRGGYILYTWGDPHFKFQSKSLGKSFTRLALQLALDKGLIGGLDDPVQTYWTGEGLLSHPYKYLTQGHHAQVTFRHFIEMKSGFPVTNGNFWEQKTDSGDQNPGIATWANWTGDPDYDNYAHVKPGKYRQYSSGGYWRLSQVLTAIWDQDLKKVLDEHIMSKIGIPAERWDWLSGEYVRNTIDFYPDFPNYGGFVDRPYAINNHVVRGGGGWVVMSASDLARLGLLFATGGVWKGEQLISKELGGWYLPGNGKAGERFNAVDGYGIVKSKDAYLSFGRVAGHLHEPSREQVASWIIGPVQASTPTGNGRHSQAPYMITPPPAIEPVRILSFY